MFKAIKDMNDASEAAEKEERGVRLTLAYWFAVLLTEGSIVFILTTACSVFRHFSTQGSDEKIPVTVTTWPNVPGTIWFALASYAGFLHEINYSNDRSKTMRWWVLPWRENCTSGMKRWQVLITGCLFFCLGIALGCIFVDEQSKGLLIALVWAPCIVGGICFVISAVWGCMDHWGQGKFMWFCCCVDVFSAVMFLAGSAAPVFDPMNADLIIYGSVIPFFAGCVGYLITGICSLAMWKWDTYGFLNIDCDEYRQRILDISRGKKARRKMSLNTIVTAIIYIVASSIATANLCMAFELKKKLETIQESVDAGLAFIVVHLLLIMTSMQPNLPKQQPFKGIMITVRFMSVVLVCDTGFHFVFLMNRLVSKDST